jgi:hypothetical protein
LDDAAAGAPDEQRLPPLGAQLGDARDRAILFMRNDLDQRVMGAQQLVEFT